MADFCHFFFWLGGQVGGRASDGGANAPSCPSLGATTDNSLKLKYILLIKISSGANCKLWTCIKWPKFENHFNVSESISCSLKKGEKKEKKKTRFIHCTPLKQNLWPKTEYAFATNTIWTILIIIKPQLRESGCQVIIRQLTELCFCCHAPLPQWFCDDSLMLFIKDSKMSCLIW